MPDDQGQQRFVFPKWINFLLPLIVIGGVGGAAYVPVVVGYGFSAKTLVVNYAPEQPIPYSHALHVDKLGLDCRYCHTTVDQAAFAAVPPTETCINCHSPGFEINPQTGKFVLNESGLPKALTGTATNGVRKTSEKLQPLWASYFSGNPVEWIKVHDVADYVYFNHAAHVNKGVSCVSCHGRVDKMEVVTTVTPLSMSWCLDCHRDPAPNLRPADQVYDMAWEPTPQPDESVNQASRRIGMELMRRYDIRDVTYMTSCSTCHR